jgi:transposase
MARPTKYTPARVAMIVAALESGMSRKGAAEYAGLDESTMANWMRRFPGFSGAVKQAEAAVELRAATSMQTAFTDGDWRAGLAWLERRRRDDWGRHDHVEIEIRRAAERVAEQTGADPDWLVKRAAEIAAAESGRGP